MYWKVICWFMFSFIYIMVYYLWTFFFFYDVYYLFQSILLSFALGLLNLQRWVSVWAWNVSLSWVCIISTFFYCIFQIFYIFLTNIDTNASISPIFIQFSYTKWLCDILKPLFHNMQIWLSFNSIVVVW